MGKYIFMFCSMFLLHLPSYGLVKAVKDFVDKLRPQPVIDINMQKMFDTLREGLIIYQEIKSLCTAPLQLCTRVIARVNQYPSPCLEELSEFRMLKQAIEQGLQGYRILLSLLQPSDSRKMTLGDRVNTSIQILQTLDKASQAAIALDSLIDAHEYAMHWERAYTTDFDHCMEMFTRRKR